MFLRFAILLSNFFVSSFRVFATVFLIFFAAIVSGFIIKFEMEELTEYELKITKAFNDASIAHGAQVIKDQEGWDYFMAMMLRLKLMSIKDQEWLQHFQPSFPCSIETFLQTITQVFADKNLRKLEEGFDDVRE